MNNIDFSQIKKIGIVGFSPDTQKDSYKVGVYLLQNGFEVFPIYPKEKYIAGQKVYHSIEELLLTHKLDCIVIFRKSESCFEIAKLILELNKEKKIQIPNVFWMQLGITNSDAQKLLESYNVKVVQDKCIMIEHKEYLNNQISQ